MGEYRNGKWEPTFGDVQAGISDYAPGERTPQEAYLQLRDRVPELEDAIFVITAENKRLREALQTIADECEIEFQYAADVANAALKDQT